LQTRGETPGLEAYRGEKAFAAVVDTEPKVVASKLVIGYCFTQDAEKSAAGGNNHERVSVGKMGRSFGHA